MNEDQPAANKLAAGFVVYAYRHFEPQILRSQ